MSSHRQLRNSIPTIRCAWSAHDYKGIAICTRVHDCLTIFSFFPSSSPFSFLSLLSHIVVHLSIVLSANAVDERKKKQDGERKCASIVLCPWHSVSSCILHLFLLSTPFFSRCFPHGQRGHVPVVMETRANRDGNSAVARSTHPLCLSFSFSLSTVSKLSFAPPY